LVQGHVAQEPKSIGKISGSRQAEQKSDLREMNRGWSARSSERKSMVVGGGKWNSEGGEKRRR